MRRLTLFGIVLSILALAACTSMRPLATVEPAALRAELKPGDEVAVTQKGGAICEGTVEALDERALIVHRTDEGHAGERAEIPYEMLAAVRVRRVDFGGMLEVFGSGVAVFFILLAVGVVVAYG